MMSTQWKNFWEDSNTEWRSLNVWWWGLNQNDPEYSKRETIYRKWKNREKIVKDRWHVFTVDMNRLWDIYSVDDDEENKRIVYDVIKHHAVGEFLKLHEAVQKTKPLRDSWEKFVDATANMTQCVGLENRFFEDGVIIHKFEADLLLRYTCEDCHRTKCVIQDVYDRISCSTHKGSGCCLASSEKKTNRR